MKLKVFSGDVEAEAELFDTPTAKEIYNGLPIEGAANIWGKEVYFVIPKKIDIEKDATEEVKVGDLAYWPEGCCFCIFFGKTPSSIVDEPRAASKVNVFGKVKNPQQFGSVNNGDLIIVERFES
jgi:uncharacterized protein